MTNRHSAMVCVGLSHDDKLSTMKGDPTTLQLVELYKDRAVRHRML